MSAAPTRFLKIELARKLEITRKTLDEYLNRDGAPRADKGKRYDLAEVAKYISENASWAGQKDEIKKLRGKKLALECERISHELSVSRNEHIPRSEVVPAIARLWGEIHGMIRQKFEFELPSQYVGKNAIECGQINIGALDLIDKRFKAGSEFKS